MSKMFFNRLHLNLSDNRLKRPFIIDGIRSVAAAGYNDYSYKIIDIETLNNYILGYLVKYDPYGRGEILDEVTGTARQGGTVNSIVAKSMFLINTDEMIIAYEEIQNLISKTMFVRMFTDLFHINHEGQDFEFSISSIREQYSFIEQVKTMREIKRVSISLVPSNPNNADLWRQTDERLQSNNITKYKEIQESNNAEGLVIDDETIAKMAMSEDGYGIAEASGKDENGHQMTITTKTRNQEITQNLPDNIERTGMSNIINYLSRTFERIRQRTNHQE
ncbi:DUF4747 family protein [Flavobacterium sp. CAU 1735]|uniref:DUF4747 family protein n=1 Tax=Flavobacterium sp. CAU 1735 TaxID=3140361 RepID=UPI00326021DF